MLHFVNQRTSHKAANRLRAPLHDQKYSEQSSRHFAPSEDFVVDSGPGGFSVLLSPEVSAGNS
jgi:hypothetical protein